jgi:hypothetical protein
MNPALTWFTRFNDLPVVHPEHAVLSRSAECPRRDAVSKYLLLPRQERPDIADENIDYTDSLPSDFDRLMNAVARA